MTTGSLTIVGTGIRAGGQVTLEAKAYLESADRVFFLVADPVTRLWIESLNSSAESLSDAYREGKKRRQSYAEMVSRILSPVSLGHQTCAAFYGHPGVFVDVSHAAIQQAREQGFEASMLPGISAEDCLFADLGVDPATCGCQSFEATDFLLRRRKFDPSSALVLWQIGAIGINVFHRRPLWNRRGLEVLTEVLAETLPREHSVVVYEAAMSAIHEPRIESHALDELPRAPVTVASTLYVPPAIESPTDPNMVRLLGLAP